MKKEADLPDARPGSGSCPGGPSDLDAIGLLLGRAYYAYLTQLGQCLKAHGIGGVVRPGMGNLLFALFERDGRTLVEVARRLGVSKAAVSGTVDRAIRAGLVETRRDARDGRRLRLHLTARGRRVEGPCRQVAATMESLLCDRFDEADAAELRRLLGLTLDGLRGRGE